MNVMIYMCVNSFLKIANHKIIQMFISYVLYLINHTILVRDNRCISSFFATLLLNQIIPVLV